uniref:Putative secreted protein n=1 Tax=Anopheles triannulatus TaxID=58253 RepID=A0A2M4B0W8_9DIPT
MPADRARAAARALLLLAHRASSVLPPGRRIWSGHRRWRVDLDHCSAGQLVHDRVRQSSPPLRTRYHRHSMLSPPSSSSSSRSTIDRDRPVSVKVMAADRHQLSSLLPMASSPGPTSSRDRRRRRQQQQQA